MNIHHTGIFVSDLEGTKIFFEKYFSLIAGEKYHNPAKRFSSYMLSSDQNFSENFNEIQNLSAVEYNKNKRGFTISTYNICL